MYWEIQGRLTAFMYCYLWFYWFWNTLFKVNKLDLPAKTLHFKV